MEHNAEEVINLFITSEGNIPLTVERYNRRYADGPKLNEYKLLSILTNSEGGMENLVKQLRSLLVLKLFSLVMDTQLKVGGILDDLKPSDLSKTYTGLVSSFAQLTNGAAKDVFDFEAEIQKVADELGVSPEEVKSEFKSDVAKSKVPK